MSRTTKRPQRVAVFEQQRGTVEVLARALHATDGLQCVASGDAVTLFEDAVAHRPESVLIGLHTAGHDAEDTVGRARRHHPNATIVVLSTYVDDEIRRLATEAGADAVLPTSVSFATVVAALCGDQLDSVGEDEPARDRDHWARRRAEQIGVTPRQHEVLHRLAEGLTPDHVARSLGITLATCRDHIKALHSTLGCSSTSEVLVVGVRNGLLPELSSPLRSGYGERSAESA